MVECGSAGGWGRGIIGMCNVFVGSGVYCLLYGDDCYGGVHSAPHKNISHASNTTIPHASTSAFYHQQYFYNFTTFNESFYKILTYKFYSADRISKIMCLK
jgi:hypothetical protein